MPFIQRFLSQRIFNIPVSCLLWRALIIKILIGSSPNFHINISLGMLTSKVHNNWWYIWLLEYNTMLLTLIICGVHLSISRERGSGILGNLFVHCYSYWYLVLGVTVMLDLTTCDTFYLVICIIIIMIHVILGLEKHVMIIIVIMLGRMMRR